MFFRNEHIAIWSSVSRTMLVNLFCDYFHTMTLTEKRAIEAKMPMPGLRATMLSLVRQNIEDYTLEEMNIVASYTMLFTNADSYEEFCKRSDDYTPVTDGRDWDMISAELVRMYTHR